MSGPIVKWYVSKWSDAPERNEFLRETAHTLFYLHRGKERRKAKVGKWEWYFDTREEAQAVIDARKAANDAARLRRLAEEAAPDLLEALRALTEYNAEMSGDVSLLDRDDLWKKAEAAIAKATGGKL